MRLDPPLSLALALALGLAAQPAAGGLTCPPGWENATSACDQTECTAPMGGGLIRVDRYASVAGTTLEEAFASLEKAVGADGTPLHELESESPVEVAGLPGLKRVYTGSARGVDLRITMVLTRDAGKDILLRAIWTIENDGLLSLLIAPSIEGWDPRETD